MNKTLLQIKSIRYFKAKIANDRTHYYVYLHVF